MIPESQEQSQIATEISPGTEDCKQDIFKLQKVNSVDKEDTSSPESCQEYKQEASSAQRLIFVMSVFLICWLPFFLWFPIVHTLVNGLD